MIFVVCDKELNKIWPTIIVVIKGWVIATSRFVLATRETKQSGCKLECCDFVVNFILICNLCLKFVVSVVSFASNV